MVNITKWKKRQWGRSVDLKFLSFIDLQNKAWLSPKLGVGGGGEAVSWAIVSANRDDFYNKSLTLNNLEEKPLFGSIVGQAPCLMVRMPGFQS